MTGTSAQPRRAVAAFLLAAALAGCSSSSGGSAAGTTTSTTAATSASASATTSSASGTTASTLVITIKNFAFTTPPSVSPGATVTVRNEDSTDHTVTADSGNAFNTPAPSGGTSTFTAPAKAGSYPFHCSIHPFMKGNLVVK